VGALIEIALQLTSRGWPVFPCDASKRPALGKADGGRGFHDALTDPDAVRALFARAPHAQLIGVPTGARSGFDALDIDPRHGGATWEYAHGGRLPITRTHITMGDGWHYLFRHADEVRSRVGCPVPGVDVRGDGGYVIVPPSPGYRVIFDAPIAPWPLWLLDLVRYAAPPTARPLVATDPGQVTDKRLEGLLRSLLARVSAAPEGLKHATLRDTARTLGGYAHLLGLSDEQLIGRLIDALPATVADWDLARKTAAWGIGEGKHAPLSLAERPVPAPRNGTRAYALAALRRASQLVAAGERQLADEARSLGRFVGAGVLSAREVTETLSTAARAAGLGEAEIEGALRPGALA
jgi:hypothetical protein